MLTRTSLETPGRPRPGYVSRSRAIAITPNGRSTYVVSYFGATVSVIGTTSNKITATIDAGTCPWAIAIKP
jgi:YVTN family beta-propeller protein